MQHFLCAIVLIMLTLSMAGCGGQAVPPVGSGTSASEVGGAGTITEAEIVVFAAASLTEAFTELGELFEADHPGSNVVFNFAGSQQLAQQLQQGAPADVFASANSRQMEGVVAEGRVVSQTVHTFARNRLVVILPTDNPGGITSLADLAQPGRQLVLANQAVPVGQYALDFLEKAEQDSQFGAAFKAGVLQNVVSYEENVRAVLSKVALGEADAGIVYISDIAGANAARVRALDIPDALNTLASYPIAPISDSQHPNLAQAFVELVLAPDGQNILAKYGFLPK